MKTALCIAVVSLAVGGPAFAAEKVTASPSHECETIAKMKVDLPKGAKFTPLNIGQYHFAAGVYVGTPPASPPPLADNALLVQMKGGNLIVWMKAECAAETRPTQVSDKLVALIRAINPVAGESSDAYSDDSKDLHL